LGLVDVWVDVRAEVCHQIQLETIASPQIQVQLVCIVQNGITKHVIQNATPGHVVQNVN
jgi:hypothetical protein